MGVSNKRTQNYCIRAFHVQVIVNVVIFLGQSVQQKSFTDEGKSTTMHLCDWSGNFRRLISDFISIYDISEFSESDEDRFLVGISALQHNVV